jgi:NTE family protein
MATRALVLGGGGPVGIGWETGLAAGLDEEGVRLGEADLIVGTSAGSVVGAQLALGRSPQEMLAVQLGRVERDRVQFRGPVDIAALIEQITKLYREERPPEALRAEIGAFALEAQTMSEDEWLESFGAMRELGLDAWPERRYVCTAIDTATGELVAWDRDSGVELSRAVASSCAVPGIFPPVTINGRRYMDGGIGSPTNARLAEGYDRVLVVSVTARRTGALATADLAEIARRRFEAELDAVRASGSAVDVIVPDDASLEAFGINLMDASRREAAAHAGVRQGRAEAPRLRSLWQG